MMPFILKNAGSRLAAMFLVAALAGILLVLAPWGADGVAAQPGNTPPTVSDTSQFKNHYAFTGQAFSLTLPAADAGSGSGGPYEYSLKTRRSSRLRVPGLSFNAQTRTISGWPTRPGTYRLSYRIHDSDGNRSWSDAFRAETNLQITVAADTVPTVSDHSQFKNHYAFTGQAFRVTLPAADAGSGNGGPYEYILWKRGAGKFGEHAIITLPTIGGDILRTDEYGLKFDPQTREVSGTPTTIGTYLLAYQIHDADPNRRKADSFVAETNLQITVLPPPPIPPTVSNASQFRNHQAMVGQPFSVTLPAADAGSGSGGPYEYILRKRGANRSFGMDGLSFNPETRVVSGTPTAPGTHLLTYLIHDGDTDRRPSDTFVWEGNLQITVSAPEGWTAPAPAVPTVSDTSQFRNHEAAIGQPFSLTLPAADAGSGNGGPYEYILWKRGAGNFGENGLKFNPQTREISGTPVVPGVFRLTYQVHDGDADRSKSDSFVAETNLQITVPSLGPDSDRQRRNSLPPAPTGLESYLTGNWYIAHKWDTMTGVRSYGFQTVTIDPSIPDSRGTWDSFGDHVDLTERRGPNRIYMSGPLGCGRSYLFRVKAEGDGVVYYNPFSPHYDAGPHSEPLFLTTPACLRPSSDQTPAFDEGATATRQVAENSPAGTNVGAPITATAVDSDTLFYWMQGADAVFFNLDTATAQLTTKAGVSYDYDTKPRYAFKVVAANGRGGYSTTAVTVNLTTENEAPAFAASTATRSVAENSAAGTNVGLPITATDPDDDALTYSLSGTDAASFEVGASTGQITTKTGETYDHETDSSYSLTVEATDGKLSASIAVTVNLTDVNEAPVFAASTATRSVAENSPAGTKVGAPVLATDPDSDALTYSLSGTDAASFEIGGSTGQITTKTDVDYDYATKPSYAVTVEAADGKGGTASIAVTVNLTEDINAAPVFRAVRSLPENSPAGTNVGYPVAAFDPDADPLTYSLSGQDGSSFEIDPATGQLKTKTGVTYDYETKPSYTVSVTASDSRNGVAAIDVTIHVTDEDEEAPTTLEPKAPTAGVPPNTPATGAPAITGTVQVDRTLTADTSGIADANGLTNVSYGYQWLSGRDTAISGATKSTYLLQTSDAGKTIKVRVTFTDDDGYEETLTSAATAPVPAPTTGPQQSKSGPPHNRAPSFAASTATRAVAENSAAGTKVGAAVTATDPDAGDTLAYSLSGTDASSFAIGASTGQITTKTGVTYDYETDSSYSLTVEASDGKLSASIAVTVNLTNVEETTDGDGGGPSGEGKDEEPANRDPSFAASTATRSVEENSAAGANVGTAVTATDPDTGDTLTYSLSGTDASSFEIGSSTGQITTKTGETYDYENKKSYSLTVEAEDGNGGTASIAVTVNLTDVGTPVAACETDLGTLSAMAEYAGAWDDAECKAHHQDSLGRYFQFTLSADTKVSISLTAGTLYVSKGTPKNGWGTTPGGGYEHRKNVRKGNGKLVHDGSENTFSGTLEAGETYTVEAAGSSGNFTVNIAPQ